MAGTAGTISGYVRDKETDAPLPGANIFVEGTTLGAMADKSGYYVIHNVPAGRYDVRAKMIGYTSVKVVGVVVNVDVDTRLDFSLSSEVLQLGQEVLVTAKRPFIYNEVSSSIHFISGNHLNNELPVDNFRDAVGLVPGVVNQHFRGGRRTDVVYLVDGLPVQGALTRELASSVPSSSIVEVMAQTGGFNAEYGHATSGIVNLVTREGRNTIEGMARFYSDASRGRFGHDNTQRLEGYLGGPMTLGFAGPVFEGNYFIAGDMNLSDTPWRDELRPAFRSPIFQNYNLNSKFTLRLSSNLKVVLQSLLSSSSWHQFDPQWRLNPRGLPLRSHNSNRLSLSLTHTLSPSTFYTLSLSRYSIRRSIRPDSTAIANPFVEFLDQNDPTSPVVGGALPWSERVKERMLLVKGDVVHQINAANQIKFGGEFQYFDISLNRTRFDYVPLRQEGSQFVALNGGRDNFERSPNFGALYIQDRLRLGDVILNFGVRYDVFDPDITPKINPADTDTTDRVPRLRTALSPRLSISFPATENERIHFNYGWFYQMPALFYLYTNSKFDLSSPFPLVGNANLKPTRTVAMELSYKRVISEDAKFIVTLFHKKMADLVDSRVYALPDTQFAGVPVSRSFAQYANTGRATVWGAETTIDRDLSRYVNAKITYTLMRAVGTSTSADGGFVQMVWGTPSTSQREFPLSWDQRHTLILDLNIHTPDRWQINVLGRVGSPLPITTPGSDVPNDSRQSWRVYLDGRVTKTFQWEKISLAPFAEIRNLLSTPDNTWQNRTGVPGAELFDPSLYDIGRRIRVGINFLWR
jgi:outer membrane receptor for ferrienterochelin and colicin